MTNKHTGWYVVCLGATILTLGAVLLFTAQSEMWATVGLVCGLLGGGGVGTGVALLLFPDAGVTYEEEDWDYRWEPPCFVHGDEPCLELTEHCPPDRVRERA